MSVRTKTSDEDKLFYVTFTCFDWLPLIKVTDSYDLVYKWFEYIERKGVEVIGYVIMPNHLHCMLNFPTKGFSLGKIVGNAKRFMAYEIVKRLGLNGEQELLEILSDSLTETQKMKGQLHNVFRDNYDAKAIRSERFLKQKLRYMHLNPIRGRWRLTDDWRTYPHSSAGFYEFGKPGYYKPVHFYELG